VGRLLCGGRSRADHTAPADHTPQLSHRYLTNDLMSFYEKKLLELIMDEGTKKLRYRTNP
jgi:hypothetical protein